MNNNLKRVESSKQQTNQKNSLRAERAQNNNIKKFYLNFSN